MKLFRYVFILLTILIHSSSLGSSNSKCKKYDPEYFNIKKVYKDTGLKNITWENENIYRYKLTAQINNKENIIVYFYSCNAFGIDAKLFIDKQKIINDEEYTLNKIKWLLNTFSIDNIEKDNLLNALTEEKILELIKTAMRDGESYKTARIQEILSEHSFHITVENNNTLGFRLRWYME